MARQRRRSAADQAVQATVVTQDVADDILLQRVLQRERQAWAEFFRRFDRLIAGTVVRVLRRYGVRAAPEDVGDMVAEVWVALLRDDQRKLRIYDRQRGSRLNSWIGLIAANTTIDYLRVRHRSSTYLEDNPEVSNALIDSRGPDRDLEERQDVELMRRAVGRLKLEDQRFARYCFQDERRPAEIAEAFGISVNTVHSRKFKLRRKITDLVAQLQRPAA